MSVSVWITEPQNPSRVSRVALSRAISRSRLSGSKLDAALKRHGIDRGQLYRYADGKASPAPWLARAIADLLRAPVDELFPVLVDDEETD